MTFKIPQLFMGLAFSLIFSAIYAQDINQTDEMGRKQGVWTKQYPNGQTMYKGTFKDNYPVGPLTRYYESGEVKAVLDFYNQGKCANAVLFYETGDTSAKGKYINNKKDSLWQYFSYYDKNLVTEETYKNGTLHGAEKVFYPTGNVSEVFYWKDGTKEGANIKYFEDGTKKSEAKYQFNQLNGPYTVYTQSGKWLLKGNFLDGKRHGAWLFYEEDGSIKYQIDYEYGVPDNQEELLLKDNEYLQKIEENLGKFKEPTIEDLMPGGEREYY